MIPRQFLAQLLLVSLLSSWLPLQAGEPSARSLYKRGRQFERAGNLAQAYILYSQAAAADPLKREYWQRAQALQTKAVTQANVSPSRLAEVAGKPDPAETVMPSATFAELYEARQPQPPVDIEGTSGSKDIDLRGNARSLWERTTKLYGLDVVFDGDYPEGGPEQRLQLTETGYREALHALMAGTGSFVVPITTKLIMVVKDTDQKRREIENTVAVSIPIPDPVSIQDAQEMARSVQQLMEIQRFAIDSTQRVAIMRDRASKVIPAQALLNQLMYGRGEIAVDIELVAIPKATSLGLGLSLPTSFSINAVEKILSLAGGPITLGFVLGTAELLASWTKSVGRSVFQAELRATDGQPTSFHAGEKYPIITNAYVGTGDTDGQTFAPPPTFNFEDLGLVLKVTPKVHDRHEVSLQIEAEYKLLGNRSVNGNPVISSRKFTNQVRLRFDQWAIVSGLVGTSSSRTLSGFAGLTSIPLLGTVLGRHESRREEEETMLILKPRLLRLPPTEAVTRGIWIGTESRLRTPL